MRADGLAVLRSILPLAAAVARGTRKLALVALAAAAVIALVVLLRWTPDEDETWVGAVILLLLLTVPGGVLLFFSFVLGEVVELPEKLLRSPQTAREHAGELRAITRDAQSREAPAWRRLPGSTWRLAGLVRSARDLIAPHAPILPLLSIPFLAAAAISALVTPLLVLAALVVLLTAAAG